MPPNARLLQQLTWLGPRGDAVITDDHLTLSTGPGTDWFNDPDGEARLSTAPVLRFDAIEDCQVLATVTVDFAAPFDAGVVFVHQGDDDYAKLCFERSPQGDNTMVSVVTRGVSDDANGPIVDGNTVHVRVSKYREVLAFHWSTNREQWHMLRFFQLRNPTAATSIGFSTQSPTGAGCTATFYNVRYVAGAPTDIRDGS